MNEGTPAILRELSGLRKAMKDIKFTDPDYPKYRMRENIVHQFENLNTRGEMVGNGSMNRKYRFNLIIIINLIITNNLIIMTNLIIIRFM